jgi:23S rRNA pseudouridine2605 synthase
MNTRINKRRELGLAPSRRKADELIETGRVSINSITITDMATKVSAEDVIEVDGRGGQTRDNITVAFYKPVGYVSSHARQTSNQRTIFDILPAAFATLGARPDSQSGLMILSSDGGTYHPQYPSFIKPKVYLVSR